MKKIIIILFCFFIFACTGYGKAKYSYSLCENDICTEIVLQNSKNIGELTAEVETKNGTKIKLTEKNVDSSSPLKQAGEINAGLISILKDKIP